MANDSEDKPQFCGKCGQRSKVLFDLFDDRSLLPGVVFRVLCDSPDNVEHVFWHDSCIIAGYLTQGPAVITLYT